MVFHIKREYVTALVTAKAVKGTPSPVYRERRGLFAMEGAASLVVGTCLFKVDVLTDYLDNVSGVFNKLNGIVFGLKCGHYSHIRVEIIGLVAAGAIAFM